MRLPSLPYRDGYEEGRDGYEYKADAWEAPFDQEAYNMGYDDGKGDRMRMLLPQLEFKTLDLRDPKVEKEFLAQIRKFGVPVT